MKFTSSLLFKVLVAIAIGLLLGLIAPAWGVRIMVTVCSLFSNLLGFSIPLIILGLLQSVLGFTPEQQALMITLYIAMDSFGTACNVTGDGAIALVVDKIAPSGTSHITIE